MKIYDFLQSVYDRIITAFPEVTIKHSFQESSGTHFVRISPLSTYQSAAFMDMEAGFYKEWLQVEENYAKDFCLISEDALVKLENATLIHQPLKVNLSISWLNSNEESQAEVLNEQNYFSDFNELNASFDSDSTTKLAA